MEFFGESFGDWFGDGFGEWFRELFVEWYGNGVGLLWGLVQWFRKWLRDLFVDWFNKLFEKHFGEWFRGLVQRMVQGLGYLLFYFKSSLTLQNKITDLDDV